MVSMNNKSRPIFQDIAFITLGILVAVVLVRTEVVIKVLTSTKELEMLGSFIAGIFFTSIFTAAPAIVTLGEIARANSIILTALLGGMGAIIGDLIIFRFVRDRLSEHLLELFKYRGAGNRFKVLLKLRYFRWLTYFIGGLIIASPLPDELGVSLLGFSKMRMSRFVILSFVLNSLGILFIGFVARAL